MSDIKLRLHGIQDEILNIFIDKGLVESKEEAIRFSLLKSALDMGLIDQKLLVKEIRKDLSRDKKLVDNLLNDIKKVKNESISG